MFKTISIPLSILTAAFTTISASAFEPPNLTAAEIASLESGEAVMSVWKGVERDKKPTVSQGGIDIMTNAAAVYDIMRDCSRMSEISSDIRLCEVLETASDGSWDIRKQKFAVSPLLPKFKTTFKTNYLAGPYGGHILQMERISGDLKVQEGRWDIIALGPNKTRVVYQAALKPKLPISGKVMRKQIGNGVPEILENLRDIAEADNASMSAIAALTSSLDM